MLQGESTTLGNAKTNKDFGFVKGLTTLHQSDVIVAHVLHVDGNKNCRTD